MEFPTFPRNKAVFSYLPSLFILISLAASLTLVWQTGHAQQAKLSLADILIALRSKKVTLAERNQIVTEAVKQRGITFGLTPDIEEELQAAGADKTLIEAVRKQSPVVKATPTPTPAPTPAPAPRPPEWINYQNQANAFFVKGDFDAAVVNYSKVIELNGKDASTYQSRGLALYNKRSYDSAIVDFTRAIELNPQESSVYFKRGDTFEKLGKFQNAIEDYQKAVDLESGNETAKASLQRLQTEQAKIASAQPKPPVTPPKKDKEKEKENDSAEKSNNKTDEKTAETAAFVNVGSLKEIAVKLAVPVYPAYERQRKTEGIVTVLVLLDENGKVLEAEATDGPKTLRQSAEDAAKRSKFNPAKVNNQPVKARGFVAYNFKAT